MRLLGTPSDEQNTLVWSPTNATSYNLYWDTSPAVTRDTGVEIGGVASPYLHSGLVNGVTYYYVVTAVNASGESDESAEASGTPGTSGWGTPLVLEFDDTDALEYPRVGIDGDGNAVVIWRRSDGDSSTLTAQHYTAAEGWGEPVPLDASPGGSESPRLAVAANGSALAVWRAFDGTHDGIASRRYEPGAGWGETEWLDVMGESASAPRIVVDDVGNAAASWIQSDGSSMRLWFQRYDAVAGWGTARPIDSGGRDVSCASLTIDGFGNALAAWQQQDDLAPELWSNRYDTTLGWEGAELIDSEEASCPELVMDANGNAILVWTRPRAQGAPGSVWANRYVLGAGWGTSTFIEDYAETEAGGDVKATLAVNPTGHATAAWLRYQSDGTPDGVWANRYDVGSGWGTPERIGGFTGTPMHRVAMDAVGDALVVWESGASRTDVWSNRFRSESGWGSEELIEWSTSTTALGPEVAMDTAGNAVAVWSENADPGPPFWILANHYWRVEELPPLNIVPFASAGLDQTVVEGAMVTLDGSGSSDVDGSIAMWSWRQTAGPTVDLSGADSMVASFVAPDVSGTTLLSFELTVADDDGDTHADRVAVAVQDVIEGVDLVVPALSAAKTTVSPGKRVKVEFTVSNLGTNKSKKTRLRLYLSTDPTIDPSDPRVKTKVIRALRPGASLRVRTKIRFKRKLVPGTYYLGALVDYRGRQVETDETNNASPVITINVEP